LIESLATATPRIAAAHTQCRLRARAALMSSVLLHAAAAAAAVAAAVVLLRLLQDPHVMPSHTLARPPALTRPHLLLSAGCVAPRLCAHSIHRAASAARSRYAF
jgi:hypothetical protein